LKWIPKKPWKQKTGPIARMNAARMNAARNRAGGGSVDASDDAEAQKTLERVISKAGAGSRTQARSWIHAGQVQVNGKVVEDPDRWIDFKRDRVLLDGKPLTKRKQIYILLYKPTGYITTFKDPEGRPTVYDLIKDIDQFVSPVGRLDLDTSGLLIMTNDTQFAERLTNPDHRIAKTYLLKCSTLLTDEALEQLRRGVVLSDGPTKPAEVRRVRDSGKYTHLEIAITEGRNRQVRRMIEAVGSKVLKLVRTHIGPVTFADLKIGQWREMEPDELAAIIGSPTRTRTSGRAPGSRIPETSRSPRPPAAPK
jgi:23S rRNA pseudouridine2605 synthase